MPQVTKNFDLNSPLGRQELCTLVLNHTLESMTSILGLGFTSHNMSPNIEGFTVKCGRQAFVYLNQLQFIDKMVDSIKADIAARDSRNFLKMIPRLDIMNPTTVTKCGTKNGISFRVTLEVNPAPGKITVDWISWK